LPKAEPLKRCPRCGYELPKGKKVMVRIWASALTEKDWKQWAKEFETQGIAFNELLRRAKLYTELERSRIAVEPPTKP